MQISRRDALRGATAAAVITGALTAPLAIKAVAAKAALASASDARIFALIEEHDRAFAEKNKARARWHESYPLDTRPLTLGGCVVGGTTHAYAASTIGGRAGGPPARNSAPSFLCSSASLKVIACYSML